MALYDDVLNRIYSLSKMGIKLGLDNMHLAMERLGIGLEGIRFIHVAGTNGKGSTAAMLHRLICDNHKGRTGLYTSPHLLRFNERIRINDSFISDAQMTQTASVIFEKCSDIPLTFFEFTTLMCFMHFEANKVDIAVIETGLGGRLDATNVIDPEVCIITSISMDHTEHLGNTLESIAIEKAGIFKKGATAVISHTPCSELLREKAAQAGVKKILVIDEDFEYSINRDGSFDLVVGDTAHGPYVKYRGLNKSLLGDHQYMNAACAIMTFDLLGFSCSEKDISGSLSRTSWPGRLERRNIAGKNIYLDVSHNPEGIHSTIKFLLEYHGNDAIHIACGFMRDKDYPLMIRMLHGVADKLFLVPTSVEGRQTSAEDYQNALDPEWKNIKICTDYEDAIDSILQEEGVILFTGSIFNFEHLSRLLGERA